MPKFSRRRPMPAFSLVSFKQSRLSFALNYKILHPRGVIESAMKSWEANPEAIGLAQIEGFIRQILGWREYMRGIYWA